MHPDVMIAALRAELDELKRSPEPDAEREREIEKQIAEADKRPRPVSLPEDPETVYDRERAYQDALEAELREAERGNEPPVRGVAAADRANEIRREIERVKAQRLARGEVPEADHSNSDAAPGDAENAGSDANGDGREDDLPAAAPKKPVRAAKGRRQGSDRGSE